MWEFLIWVVSLSPVFSWYYPNKNVYNEKWSKNWVHFYDCRSLSVAPYSLAVPKNMATVGSISICLINDRLIRLDSGPTRDPFLPSCRTTAFSSPPPSRFFPVQLFPAPSQAALRPWTVKNGKQNPEHRPGNPKHCRSHIRLAPGERTTGPNSGSWPLVCSPFCDPSCPASLIWRPGGHFWNKTRHTWIRWNTFVISAAAWMVWRDLLTLRGWSPSNRWALQRWWCFRSACCREESTEMETRTAKHRRCSAEDRRLTSWRWRPSWWPRRRPRCPRRCRLSQWFSGYQRHWWHQLWPLSPIWQPGRHSSAIERHFQNMRFI